MEAIGRKGFGVTGVLVSVPSLHHSSTPFFSFVSQHLLQGSIFSERLGPAEVFFEIGAGFDQILNHVLDSFVGHEGAALNRRA